MGILRHIMRDVVKPVLVDVGDRFWTNPWRSISPIKLRVEYTDTQFEFKFKAPSTSTLNIYDGDGTMTPVAGNDDTLVTHTTSYAAPGTYYFYVEGDYLDITYIGIIHQSFVNGNINRLAELINLTGFAGGSTPLAGSLNGLSSLNDLHAIQCSSCPSMSVNVELFTIRDMTTFTFTEGVAIGDMSQLYTSTAPSVAFFGTNVTFDNIVNFTAGNLFYAYDCSWTSEMVDNCLISLANGATTGRKIKIHGTNAARTPASDAAYAYLVANNTSVEVNSYE